MLKNECFIKENVSSDAIIEFMTLCKENKIGVHAFEVYEKGECLIRCSAYPYSCEDKRQLYSLSKMFSSTAIGFAVDEGLLTVEDAIVDIFPDKLPEIVGENLKKMKVKHVLSMNTGHAACTMPYIVKSDDGVKTFLSIEPEFEPGTHFTYNTGATYMLSAIITKLTGMSMYDYLNIKFFMPLGIKNAYWDMCGGNVTEGGVGLHVSCDDITKLAIFYLNRGMWEGKQLLSGEWIDEASRMHSDNSTNGTSDWTAGYGYQIWMNAQEGYRGDGAYGQLAIVLPDRDLVFTTLAYVDDMQKEEDLVFELIKKIHKPDSRYSKSDVEDMLRNTYNIPASSDEMTGCAGKIYKCDENVQGITFISFEENHEKLVMTLIDGKCSQDIVCGNGEFIENNIFMKNMKPTITTLIDTGKMSHLRFAASCTRERNRAVIHLRYLNTPHTETVTLKFDKDELNITFEDKERTIEENAQKIKAVLYN